MTDEDEGPAGELKGENVNVAAAEMEGSGLTSRRSVMFEVPFEFVRAPTAGNVEVVAGATGTEAARSPVVSRIREKGNREPLEASNVT